MTLHGIEQTCELITREFVLGFETCNIDTKRIKLETKILKGGSAGLGESVRK